MNIQRSIIFKTKGGSYTLNFPTVGEYRQIEVQKSGLSAGLYGELINSGTISAAKALDFIDMQAILVVMCPKVITDLKVDSFDDLDIFDANDLLRTYSEQIRPWIESWMKLLKSPPAIENEGTEETEHK